MAAAATMPWPQQMFGCFGSKLAASQAAPSARAVQREDSAHETHNHSGSMATSDKSSSATSSDSPAARLALSEPPAQPSTHPGPGYTRSASIQVPRPDHRTSATASEQEPSDRQRSRRCRSGCQDTSGGARTVEDWHRLKRFAFVSDICSNAAAGTTTKLMLNRKTEELVSIKFLDRRRGAVDAVTQGELLNHKRLHCAHIARLKETFITESYLAVVTEHAPGGSLHRRVAQCGRLSEDEARTYFRQLVAALAHCHGQGVYHRDLQLSAVRLDACGGVVLTDFGYSAAKLSGSGEHADARDRSSTPAFTPPEVLLGHSIVNASYDGESLDVWAIGIILYVMVFGGFPFEEPSRSTPRRSQNIIKRLLRLDYRFPSSVPVSQPLKELLCRVFVKTREARIGLAELAAHPWVVDGGKLPPIATAPTPAGTPRGVRTSSVESTRSAHADRLFRGASNDYSQAPESPLGSVRASLSGSGGLFSAFRRDKSQTEADIAAIVKKALVRPS